MVGHSGLFGKYNQEEALQDRAEKDEEIIAKQKTSA
jgi:hypothetical protein